MHKKDGIWHWSAADLPDENITTEYKDNDDGTISVLTQQCNFQKSSSDVLLIGNIILGNSVRCECRIPKNKIVIGGKTVLLCIYHQKLCDVKFIIHSNSVEYFYKQHNIIAKRILFGFTYYITTIIPSIKEMHFGEDGCMMCGVSTAEGICAIAARRYWRHKYLYIAWIIGILTCDDVRKYTFDVIFEVMRLDMGF